MVKNSTERKVRGFACYGIIHKINGEPRKITTHQDLIRADCGEVFDISRLKKMYYEGHMPSKESWTFCTCCYDVICPMSAQMTLTQTFDRLSDRLQNSD